MQWGTTVATTNQSQIKHTALPIFTRTSPLVNPGSRETKTMAGNGNWAPAGYNGGRGPSTPVMRRRFSENSSTVTC